MLALTFETSKLNDPMRGHVFGSDDESCDVLLDYGNKRLISSQHFRIIFDWHRRNPDRLWLYDLSKNGTIVSDTNVRELSARRVALSHETTVRAGPVLLKISLPQPPVDDPLFMARWEAYRQHALAATPKPIAHLKRRFDPTPDAMSAANSVRGLSCHVYYPIRPLGSGASGRVFQVRRASDRKVFAMKDITQRPSATGSGVDKLRREMKVITSIHHQHVTACLDYASEPGKLWLITDYAPYGDLESLLAERSNYFSETETVLVARQILAALSYLHSMDIVHRDVKGENILIFRRHPEHYRLTDFDLSRFLTDSKDLSFCGTAALCAPEVFPQVSERVYDHKADVWSLGVMLYRVLTGQYPFPLVADQMNMYNSLVNWTTDQKENALAPYISDTGRNAILGMLERDVPARPAANDCLKHPWFSDSANVGQASATPLATSAGDRESQGRNNKRPRESAASSIIAGPLWESRGDPSLPSISESI